jgi:hypothetical protein
MSDVQPRPLHWLWKYWLALGKLALLDGDPGQAKSMLLVDLAARVSRGQVMPDGSPGIEGDVTFLWPEDGLSDTLRPRLEAAGANLNRVHVIVPHLEHGITMWRGHAHNGIPWVARPERREGRGKHARSPRPSKTQGVPPMPGSERHPLLAHDLPRLEDHLRATECRLLIVERFLPEWDRMMLQRLADLAERAGCAVIVSRFLNKYAGGKAIYRGAGGMAAIGAARSAMLVAPEPGQAPPYPRPVAPGHSPGRERGERPVRILASTKNNLGPRPDSLRFTLEILPGDVPRLHWLGASPLTADDLLVLDSRTEGKSAATEAEKFLKDLLKDGPMAAQLCYEEAAKQSICETSLRRAKIRLGIRHNQPHDLLGLFVPATWELPHGHDSGIRGQESGVRLRESEVSEGQVPPHS